MDCTYWKGYIDCKPFKLFSDVDVSLFKKALNGIYQYYLMEKTRKKIFLLQLLLGALSTIREGGGSFSHIGKINFF